MQGWARLFSYCLSKLWFLGVTLLVLAALLVSGLRASLPYLNRYHVEFSHYIQQHYDVNLTISSISGRWVDGGPELTISQLVFDDLERQGLRFETETLTLQLDLRRSLLAFSPRLPLVQLEHVKLTVGQLKATHVPGSDPIPGLFNLVQDIVVNDAEIILLPEIYGELPRTHIASLHWLNSTKRHQLQLMLSGVDNHLPLSLVADFYGQSKNDIKGRVYVKAQDWRWLEQLKPLLPPLNLSAQAQASFELWADISNGALDSVVLQVGDNHLDWQDKNQQNSLSLGQTQWQWLPHTAGWLMEAQAIKVLFNHAHWPLIDLSLSQQQGQLNAQATQLSLGALLKLRGLVPNISVELERLLEQLSPQADIRDVMLWQQDQQWHYRGQVHNYRQQFVDGLPKLSGLTWFFSGDQQQGQAQISLENQPLDFKQYLLKPLTIKEFNATIKWQFGDDRWWLFSDDFRIATPDITSRLAWQLAFDSEESPVLSLYGQVNMLQLNKTKYYLPQGVLSKGLIDYLGDGIKNGVIEDAELMWQGKLSGFPYQDHSGIFQVDAKINNAKFVFDPNWLPVENATLQLNFENEAMTLTSQQGRVKGLNYQDLNVVIADLTNKPVVEVTLDIANKITPINDLIANSPLKDSVGAALKQLNVSGQVSANIDINIPLAHGKSIISGQITLHNNRIDILALDIAMSKVSGQLNFVDGVISSDKLRAQIYNQPIKLTINTKPIGHDYGIEIDLAAKWYSKKMPALWHQYLDDYLGGSLDWQGKITLKIMDDDVLYQANFKSPMTGLELKLPKPLDKYVDQQEFLTLSVSGNTEHGQFNLALGSRAETLAQYDLGDGGLEIANMALLVGRRFNAQDPVVSNDMSLTVDLKTLQIDEWQTFINNLEQGRSDSQFLPPLRSINIAVEQLQVYGQTLTNVSLAGFKNEQFWQVGLLSDQAKGVIKLHHNLEEQGIIAEFDYFKLAIDSQGDRQAFTKTQILEIPKLQFSCLVCQVGDYELGEVSFTTAKTELGMVIENLSLQALSTSLLMSGLWSADDNGEFAKINGHMISDNIADTLNILNLGSSIKDSDGKVDFDVNWRGAIFAPQLSTIAGVLNWHFGEGHISEVSDQGARIFSLFSLDSLRRKLVLDFRDVFVKGVFFNSFEGSFAIDQGVAVTHDTHMDGIAGDLEVLGSINLATTELDYYLTFTPRLFSNIPVVAGVVTSAPQVFILAFALTKVLEPIIDVVSQVNFKLTGDITKPQFIEINRKLKKYIVPSHMLTKPDINPEKASETSGDSTDIKP